MRIKFSNAREALALLKAVGTFNEEVQFSYVESKGLSLRQMDPSHISMFDLSLERPYFDIAEGLPRFGLETPEIVLLSLKALTGIIGKPGKDDSLELETVHYPPDTPSAEELLKLQEEGRPYEPKVKPSKLLVKLGSIQGEMKTLEPNLDDELPIPKTPFENRVKFAAKSLRDAFVKASNMGDNATIDLEFDGILPSAFTITTKGQWENDSKITQRFLKMDDSILEMDSTAKKTPGLPYRSNYNLNYLVKAVQALSSITPILIIEWAHNMPMKITAEMPNNAARLTFYMAPKIEDDDMPVAPEPVPQASQIENVPSIEDLGIPSESPHTEDLPPQPVIIEPQTTANIHDNPESYGEDDADDTGAKTVQSDLDPLLEKGLGNEQTPQQVGLSTQPDPVLTPIPSNGEVSPTMVAEEEEDTPSEEEPLTPEPLSPLNEDFRSKLQSNSNMIYAAVVDENSNWLWYGKVPSLDEALEMAKKTVDEYDPNIKTYAFRIVEEVSSIHDVMARRYL